MSVGRLITLEGGEGCGKTTNLTFVADFLRDHGQQVVVTREPGGTPFAEKIRDLLLAKGDERVAEDTELLLMFAARVQHLQQKILPALAAGQWVVCSRFVDSAYAYQGYGRGVKLDRIAAIERAVMPDFQPYLTVLLDLPVKVGMARARARAELDRIEQEDLSFFEAVRQGLLQRAQQYPDRVSVINADQTLPEVQEAIAQRLVRLL